MSKRSRRSHTPAICAKTRKVKFHDRIHAELTLENIQLRARRTIHDEKRSYYCEFCHGYHLTSEELRTPARGIAHSA